MNKITFLEKLKNNDNKTDVEKNEILFNLDSKLFDQIIEDHGLQRKSFVLNLWQNTVKEDVEQGTDINDNLDIYGMELSRILDIIHGDEFNLYDWNSYEDNDLLKSSELINLMIEQYKK